MTQQEKLDAIDRYFENISPEEFNQILEKKYNIHRTVEKEDTSDSEGK